MDYFKPWRRKIGVLTLVITCVFMTGWMRSFATWDGIQIPSDESFCQLVSQKGVMAWSSTAGTDLATGTNLANGPNQVKRWKWGAVPISVIDQMPKSENAGAF